MNTPVHILYLEDSSRDAELIHDLLGRAGLLCALQVVADRAGYESALSQTPYDLILSDYAIPGYDGMAALALAREKQPSVPFILISGTLGEERAVDCMLQGATDYVLKQRLERLVPAILRALAEAEQHRARRRAEEALRDSEARLRMLGDNIPSSAIYQRWIHPDGRNGYRYLSAGIERIFGMSSEHVMANPAFFLELIVEEDRPRLAAAEQQSAQNLTVFDCEFRQRTVTGEVKWIHARSIPRRLEDGSTLWDGVVTDITERKQAEMLQARLLHILEFSLNEIYVFDTESLRFEYVNQGAMCNLGYTMESLRNMTPLDLKPEFTEIHFRQMIVPLLRHEQNLLRFETVHRRADGSLYPVEIHLQLVEVQEQRVFLAVILDITARKRAEKERDALQAQLAQAQKMESIGQLAGGVAHDFNNILAAIMMSVNLLRLNPTLDFEANQSLRDLMDEAKRAANLTRQLLLFSRRASMEAGAVDLNELVTNLLKMLSRLIGENIDLRFNRHPELPAVQADPSMMEQVLMNLCVNARDAMPRGGTLLVDLEPFELDGARAQAYPQQPPGKYVCLSVTDTGCGMDKVTLERIFEPFFTTKEIGKGTGLGLATVHGIVGQHKGWVEVESQIGQGTRFRVFIPAAQITAQDAESPQKPTVLRGDETILFVEDEDRLRRITLRNLQFLGYRVVEAANGTEALRAWEQHGPGINLLLTDMIMPGEMTGLELANTLRQSQPDLKVIIVSGYSFGQGLIEHIAGEGNPIFQLQKPYQIEDLSKTIRECLDRR